MSLANLCMAHPRFVNNPAYRADIDGLRALAVLAVIGFHFGIKGFSGGYVGVDVFFVISGYLITQLIRNGLTAGSFSFLHFYERRARRLLPSLLVVLLLSTLFAVLMFSPADLIRYASALASSLLFVANIVFYAQSGYFNSDVDDKPLLHLWSLSVEEQFYLLWPLLMLLVMRRRLPVALTLGTLGLASLVLAIVLTRINPEAAFYLLPTRIVEFLIGAALVWLPGVLPSQRGMLDVSLLIGVMLIVASIGLFTSHTPFPSYRALVPTLGAALIIYAGTHETSLRRYLGWDGFAYLGRISYQLYLFHWPVFIFYRYLAFSALTSGDLWLLAGMTALLSMLTYHFVDAPLRFGFASSLRQRHDFLIGCMVATILLLITAFAMKQQNGWIWRIPKESRMFTQNPGEFHKTNFGGADYYNNKFYTLGDPTVAPSFVLMGDSFAAQYAHALDAFLKKEHRSATLYFQAGCLLMPGMLSAMEAVETSKCQHALSEAAGALANNSLPILYAQSWHAYKHALRQLDGSPIGFDERNNVGYYQFIIDGIERVRQHFAGHHLVVVGIAPGIKDQKSIARCFRIPNYLPNKCADSVAFPEAEQLNGQEFNIAAQKYVAAHPEVTFLNPRDALCWEGQCHAIDSAKVFYSDYTHLSKDGAAFVIEHSAELIRSLHP